MLFSIVTVRRGLSVAVMLLALSTTGVAVSAPVNGSEGIALVSIEVSNGVNVKREDLESAVMKGLAVAGRPMVTADDAKARAEEGKSELACQSAPCWSRLGRLTNAGYLVSGSAVREGDNFRVQFRLVRASDGSTLASEDNKCEIADCSIAELARRSARELVRQTLGRAGEGPVAEPAPPGAPLMVRPIAVQASVDGAPPPEASRRRWVWPVLAGLGIAGIGAGVGLIAIDDKNIPWREGKQFTNGLPWGLTAIGAGLALGGVALYNILADGGDQAVAVGIGPAGITATGRF
jgi:hypothetical protein